jgi:RES domain-containing protein
VTSGHLDRALKCYRIGDPNGAYPIFDATGSKLYPGRWNTAASPMIYASEHYSTAILEKLVHGSGRLPPNQHFIEIVIPQGASYERLDPAGLPGWDDAGSAASRRHGADWQRSRRSLLLIVPSVVARLDLNILINPEHPEISQLAIAEPQPVWWDRRLFGSER